MRRLLSAVGTAGFAIPGWAAPAPVSPAADALVEKLSADRFADREAAGQSLLKLGGDALPALERAADLGRDPEARERAGRLAELIRKTQDNARLLAAPPVAFDYAATPLTAALADLKTKTGIPLAITPSGVKDQLRPVTAKAGPLPPWQAVEAFCKAAGLREVFGADGTPSGGQQQVEVVGRRRIAYSMAEIPHMLPGAIPVLLADGKPDDLSGDRSTAVRVVALPAGFPGNRVIRGAGEVILNLDVTPLPGLRWQEASAVRVFRAEDEAGRPVGLSFRVEPPTGTGHAWGEQVFWGGGIGGNVVMFDEYGGVRSPAKPNPRVVPVRLRTDDRAVARLRVLEGAVIGEVSLPDQTLIAVNDLPKANGLTFHGPNDAKLTVAGYEAKPDGAVVVRLRVDGPNPWTMQRLGLRNRFAAMNALPIVPGEGIGLAAGLGQVKLYDAAGKLVRPPSVTQDNRSDDGFRQTQDLEMAFPAGTSPTRLAVVGNKAVTVEVPFRMADVRLP